jgi:hypothetical protein
MKIAGSVGVGLGLTLLICIGAAAWSSGQQTGEKAVPLAGRSADLRERVTVLRTEVDVLQLEYDGLRVTRVQWIRDLGKSDLVGVDVAALSIMMKLELGGITGDAASLSEMSRHLGALDSKKPDEANDESGGQVRIPTMVDMTSHGIKSAAVAGPRACRA